MSTQALYRNDDGRVACLKHTDLTHQSQVPAGDSSVCATCDVERSPLFTFGYRQQTWKIVALHSVNVFMTGDGWTHRAEVMRLNGKKRYYANIQIADGVVVAVNVIGV